MVMITLPSGQQVPTNRTDLKDIMSRMETHKRYWPTTRELGEIMMTNRAKRAAKLRAARQRAMERYRQR